jgi:hypothetical protein
MQLIEQTERSLLGSCLWYNAHYREAAKRIRVEDFYLDSHKRFWKRMGEMIAAGRDVNYLSIAAELDKHSELSTCGGLAYLASLTEGLPPRVKSVAEYLRHIEEASRLRRVQRIAEGLIAMAKQGEDSAAVIIAAKDQLAEMEVRLSESSDEGMFQDAVEFAAETESTVDWLVEGIIPRAGNGIVGGHPKASKSFAAMDLAIAAGCGVPWLGMRIPKGVKTALVSREDDPGLTRRRLKKLIAGRPEYARLSDRMLVNTRHHQADFKVTNDLHMGRLIEQLGNFGAELVILDVFRSLHNGDENDNTEVAKVLEKVSRIQTELKCATGLVHHIAKVEQGNIFRGLRGASAIHGWMEWGIGISVVNPDEDDRANYVRKAEFESKEATTAPVCYQIKESADHSTAALTLVDRSAMKPQSRGKVASILPPPERERKDWA